ncbi:hypothetical protein ACUOFC_64490, partial [Escherichia sp. TWPC-MK]
MTIVTPPNMNEEITVVGNKASESYKTQWAIETVLMRISFVSRLIRALYVIPAPDASACGLNRFL